MTKIKRPIGARHGFAIACATTLLLAAPGAWAHHAFNMYSNEKYVPLDGEVKSYVWKNPHTMIDFVALNKDGTQTSWSIECSSPNIIGRKGWGPDSIKEGDKLHVVLHPMKDGSQIGLMVAATLPNGQVLKDKD
jgi:hypothetical protein